MSVLNHETIVGRHKKINFLKGVDIRNFLWKNSACVEMNYKHLSYILDFM